MTGSISKVIVLTAQGNGTHRNRCYRHKSFTPSGRIPISKEKTHGIYFDSIFQDKLIEHCITERQVLYLIAWGLSTPLTYGRTIIR